MGIHGLTKVIGDHAAAALASNEIKNYFGRKVAIDASMSIYQFLIAVRSTDGNQLTNESGDTTSHLMGILYRTVRMVENGIKPCYVFDGKPPAMKSEEVTIINPAGKAWNKEGRSNQRNGKSPRNWRSREYRQVQQKNCQGHQRGIDDLMKHNEECQKLLDLMGIPWINAPCEAEAQCAALARAGKVYGVGSEDMDTLTFGAPVLLRHLTFSEAKKMPISEIHFQKILEGLEFTHEEFIDLCILLGCDYCDSIRGIGPHRAVQLMKEHRSIEKILKTLDPKKYPIPESWPYQEARKLFKEPDVTDPSTVELKWKAPDEEEIVKYLVNEKQFNEERVRKTVQRMKKSQSQSTQGRLDGFFKVLPKDPATQKRKKHFLQIEAAQKARISSSPHYHARVAASQSRMNNNNIVINPNPVPVDLGSDANLTPTALPQPVTSNWTALDMGGMMINNLNNGLFAYKFLTALYLNHNNLTILPPEISKLSSLSHLNLTGNKLAVLPAELGLVVTLKELLLFDNQIQYIPQEFGQLYQLELLGLEGNPIGEPINSMINDVGTREVISYLRDNCPCRNSLILGPPQPADREWQEIEENTANSSDTFTIMCYNALCEKYASPATYGYTPTWSLIWDYRKDLLIHEILNYNADIVCLQEVETRQYEEFFKEQLAQHDYEGQFSPKSRARTMGELDRVQVDGCATMYKSQKYFRVNTRFKLLEKKLIEFQQVAMSRPDLRRSDDVLNRVMIKDNIALILLLESKETGAKILVANAHLHWDPAYSDVKVIQTALLVEEVERLSAQWAKTYNNGPQSILICGDFNSLPDSGVVEFLKEGSISPEHGDLSSYNYHNFIERGLKHNLNLKSAYSYCEDLAFTNFTPMFKGIIDYIWYDTGSLITTGLLGGVDKSYAANTVGFPNPHHPSDHIPLIVSMRIKNSANITRKVSFK
ncbi:Elongation of fatty acids protein 2 [Terramyces sp. JEL0728]|nr:Elongation of fatty acids protein 2 [Terramyces sp. JEL0728]